MSQIYGAAPTSFYISSYAPVNTASGAIEPPLIIARYGLGVFSVFATLACLPRRISMGCVLPRVGKMREPLLKKNVRDNSSPTRIAVHGTANKSFRCVFTQLSFHR